LGPQQLLESSLVFVVRNALYLLEAHWLTPSSVHLLAAAAAIHNKKGIPRKVSTSGLRGDIVRFAQQSSATRCPLDPLLLCRTASLRIYQWHLSDRTAFTV